MVAKGHGKGGKMGMGCCEGMAAFQLYVTNFLIASGALMMIIFGIILMSKYLTVFALFIMIIGGCLALVAIMGFCSATTEANNRIWVYMIMLLIALIVQIIMAMYFTIDPDVVSDDEGCMTYDNSTAIASCSPYNATTWCDYSTCTSSNSTCCCSCDSDCKDCLSSVQSVSDFMADYEDAVKVALWVVAIIEAVALMAAYCKMSNAEDRETATELNDDAPDLKPSDQAALHAKYGDRAVVSH